MYPSGAFFSSHWVRLLTLTSALGLLGPSHILAQRYKLAYDRGTEAGDRLDLLEHQIDGARKREVMARFVRDFPTHPAVSYVLEALQKESVRLKAPRQAIEYGEKLLAIHPDDFDAMWRCWKSAESLGVAETTELWRKRVLELAARVANSPKPKDLEPAHWEQTVQLAKGLLAEREYEVFRDALTKPQPLERAHLLDQFAQRYPTSPYAAQTWPHRMHAYRVAGDTVRTLAMADKVLAKDPENIDAHLYIAQILMERRTNYSRVIASASLVVQLAGSKPKPPEYTDADWEKRKVHYLGSAYLLLGNAHVNTNSFPAADRALRAALPYVKGTGQTEAAVLFYLGWSNYHLEKYADAAAFFQQCMGFGGEYAAQASKNLAGMRTERRINE
jgi:tetratricopeptide (TPR) repeat protein